MWKEQENRSKLKQMHFTTPKDIQKSDLDGFYVYINWVHQFNNLKLPGSIYSGS